MTNFSAFLLFTLIIAIVPIRGGTSRENPCRVGYRVRKLKSGLGPGRVYPMRIGKSPQYSQACFRKYANWIGSQAIDRAAIFRIFSPQRFCTHRVNGTINGEKLAIVHIRTFAHYRVGYLGSGFAHLLPDVYGSGVHSTPSSDNSNRKNAKFKFKLAWKQLFEGINMSIKLIFAVNSKL